MTVEPGSSRTSHAPTEEALAGGAFGFVLGGVAGTWQFPFVGTFLWGIAGAGLGALVGIVTGLALQALTRVTTAHWAVRLLGGLTAGSWAVVASLSGPGRKLLLGGLTAGSVVGAIVGLGIGVVAYLPTSPVAMVEGSVLGATAGLLLATTLALAALTVSSLKRCLRTWLPATGGRGWRHG